MTNVSSEDTRNNAFMAEIGSTYRMPRDTARIAEDLPFVRRLTASAIRANPDRVEGLRAEFLCVQKRVTPETLMERGGGDVHTTVLSAEAGKDPSDDAIGDVSKVDGPVPDPSTGTVPTLPPTADPTLQPTADTTPLPTGVDPVDAAVAIAPDETADAKDPASQPTGVDPVDKATSETTIDTDKIKEAGVESEARKPSGENTQRDAPPPRSSKESVRRSKESGTSRSASSSVAVNERSSEKKNPARSLSDALRDQCIDVMAHVSLHDVKEQSKREPVPVLERKLYDVFMYYAKAITEVAELGGGAIHTKVYKAGELNPIDG